MNILHVGDTLSDFSALSTGDKTITLLDYRGKNLILYFYPKDNTPGCTLEGQDFRDNIDAFTALNTVILGVSRDSVKVHEGFKGKQSFPFDLLADKNEALCELFDVIKMKNVYGKQVRGIERSTFLINGEGVLQYEWRKVNVKIHIAEVLAKLNELNK